MLPHSLSIVTPSRNRPDLLADCLSSVREHSPPDTEVIVIDDGSNNAVISQVAKRFVGVRIIRHESSMGFATAANRGIAAATGKIIELLNDDTQVTASWAHAALRCFGDPTVAAVAPLVLQGAQHRGGRTPLLHRIAAEAEFCRHVTIDSAGDEYDCGGFARKRGHGRQLSDGFRVPCEVFGASASSAFYRADVLRAVGGFPEGFGAYFEDVDLAWRIRRAGYRAVYEPNSLVWHRVGSSYRKDRRLLERQSQNEERVYWRNIPHIWRTLPRHLAVLVAKAMRRIREGTLVPWTFGRIRAWSELPSILLRQRSI